MTPESMVNLTREIDALIAKRHFIGENLPPVKLADVKNDRAFQQDVRDWMSRSMPSIDTTMLDRDDADRWTLLTPRYEIREGRVWDTTDGVFVEDTQDQGADDLCYDMNTEDVQNRYGFPFAWNIGWMLTHDDWHNELREAGFLVYDYDGGEAIIAGIDGGGYAFMDAHFMPLYAAIAEKYEWLVETSHGPRRITTK